MNPLVTAVLLTVSVGATKDVEAVLNNFHHAAEGRALLCGFGFACAVGSGEILGLFNVFVVSSVVENPPGYFKKGLCLTR